MGQANQQEEWTIYVTSQPPRMDIAFHSLDCERAELNHFKAQANLIISSDLQVKIRNLGLEVTPRFSLFGQCVCVHVKHTGPGVQSIGAAICDPG